jgi:hypothetical protein
MIYFAPENQEHLVRAGLRAGRMCYFAGRAAPMGAVGAGVVAASFYNFSPELVAQHIPAAWKLASPATVVIARFAAADAALRRLLGDEVVTSDVVREAARLARTASEACTPEGRPLYAGHARLEWPEEPHLVLWHAVSLLREYRGDGHVQTLSTAGLDGPEALITHVATGSGFTPAFAKTSRGWSDEQWESALVRLRDRGLLDLNGTITDAGEDLRRQVEDETDRLDAAPWEHLGAEPSARLAEIAAELSRVIVRAGAFPSGVFARR